MTPKQKWLSSLQNMKFKGDQITERPKLGRVIGGLCWTKERQSQWLPRGCLLEPPRGPLKNTVAWLPAPDTDLICMGCSLGCVWDILEAVRVILTCSRVWERGTDAETRRANQIWPGEGYRGDFAAPCTGRRCLCRVGVRNGAAGLNRGHWG